MRFLYLALMGLTAASLGKFAFRKHVNVANL